MIYLGMSAVFLCGVLSGYGVKTDNGLIVLGILIGLLIGIKTGWEA